MSEQEEEPTESVQSESPPEETSPPEGEASSNDDLNLYDGVHTSDFLEFRSSIGDLTRVQVESSAPDRRAMVDYEAPDGSAMAKIAAYYPEAADPGPIDDTSDPAYSTVVDSAVVALEEAGAHVEQRSVEAGGFEWDCIDAPESQQNGTIDHTMCFTLAYGRAIDLQYVSLHEPESDSRQAVIDELLEDVGEGLVELSN